MNILLVEDEVGIRDGLATVLRMKGHVVRTAPSCEAGLALLSRADYDLVVTDWRLGDGCGREILDGCTCPAVVMTGYPEEVGDVQEQVAVLCKPVDPTDLVEVVDDAAGAMCEPVAFSDSIAHLPTDTCDRLQLGFELLGRPEQASVTEIGECIALHAPWSVTEDAVLEALETLGGDLRVLGSEPAHLEWRLFASGHPDDIPVLSPDDAWPEPETEIAVDFWKTTILPDEFVDLARRAARRGDQGQVVHFLNIPPHLRLHSEILGDDVVLPMRPKSGPRLPEVLVELWRDG